MVFGIYKFDLQVDKSKFKEKSKIVLIAGIIIQYLIELSKHIQIMAIGKKQRFLQ